MRPNDLADLPHFMGCLLQEYGQQRCNLQRTGQDQTKTDDKHKHLVNPPPSHFSQLDK
ncbi:hypothetical protein GBF38_011339, partial [Nibea albiflora]